EGGTEADRVLAAGQGDDVLGVAQVGQYGVAGGLVGQVGGDHQAPAADIGDGRGLGRHGVQARHEPLALRLRRVDEALGLDDLENTAGADHVDETTAPGGVDTPGDREDVVRHLVEAPAGHDAAHLDLLRERDDVRRQAELLIRPGRPGGPGAGLHFVDDEQRVVFVRQALHRLEELRAHVVVAAFALDRLGDERGDVVRVVGEGLPGLGQRALFGNRHLVQVIGEREPDRRYVDPRPVELRIPG